MRVTFDQCDSTEEVCGLLNKVFANQEQMEGKILQLSKRVESLEVKNKEETKAEPKPIVAKKPKVKAEPKSKKKGKSKMKSKGSVSTRIVAILMLIAAIAGLSYAAYVPSDINSEIAANHDLLAQYLRDVTSNMASDSYLFTPRAVAPRAIEGRIYYDSGSDEWIGWKGSLAAGGWTTFAVAAGTSLNAAYGLGDTITANAATVLIQTTAANANPVLTVTHSGAAAGDGILINVNGTSDGIEIENTGTGYDIEGTANWYITNAGVIVGASADFPGAAGISLQNDETITNANGKITFTDVGGTAEDFTFDLNAAGNTVGLESSTGVTVLAMGAVDDLTGVGTIVFDNAATAAITMTGTGTNNLTISQAGVADDSLILTSAGNPVDAITISATDAAGGIDIDANNDIDIQVTSSGAGEDILITQVGGNNSSIIITAAGQDTDAIKLLTTDALGDIWIDSGDDLVIDVAGLLDLNLAGAQDFDLDAAGGINITSDEAADGAITIETSDAAGNIIVTSTDATADALDINTTAGGIDVDSASTIAIDNAAGNISINSAAGIVDIDAALAITIDNSDAGEDISVTSALGSVNIIASESDAASVVIQSTAGGIDILASGAAGGEDIDIIATGSSVNITSSENADMAIKILTSNAAGNIQIQSADATADAIDINATAGGLDVDIADTIAIDAAAGDISIDSAAGSIIIRGDESAVDAIWLDADTGVNGGVKIDAAIGGIDMNVASGDVTVDAAGAVGDVITVTNTTGTGNAAIALVAVAGGIDVDAVKAIDIESTLAGASAVILDASNADGGMTLNAGTNGIALGAASGDITLTSVGDASDLVTITNTTGNVAAAIALVATAGGVEIDAPAGKIIAIDGGTVTIDSKTAGAGAIALTSATGAGDTITILNTAGTAVATDAMAIQLTASAGSIGLKSATSTAVTDDAAAITLLAEAGGISLLSEANVTPSIQLHADGGVNEKISIKATQSTQDDGIIVDSVAGGIDIDAAKVINIQGDLAAASAIIVNASAGGFDIDGNAAISRITNTSTGDAQDLIIEAVGAHESGILIQSAADASPDSIKILESGAATSGGILIQAATGVAYADGVASLQLTSTSGGVAISAGVAQANAINFDAAAGGFDVDAALAIDLASSWANAAAIVINASNAAGGIDITAHEDIDITLIASGADEDIIISTTGNQDSHITILADGTGIDALDIDTDLGGIDIDAVLSLALGSAEAQADAISLQASAGGIDIDALAAFDVDIAGGQVLIASKDDAGSAIRLFTNVGVSETIVITNTLGQDDAALNIDTTAGGVAVDAAKSIVLTSSEAQSDAIQIEASNASGGIVLTTGVATGVLINTASFEHKVKYFPISAGVTAATEVIVGGGTGLTCIGLAAGVNEIGSTEGFASVDDQTDYVLFSVSLPDDFVDVGGVGDLILNFDLHETGTAVEINIVVKVYEYDGNANTTAIVDDTLTIASDVSRRMETFDVLSSGMGADVELNQGDHLIIELSSVAAEDDFNIYGLEMIYRCGLAATQ